MKKIEKWICIQTSSHSKKYLTRGKIYDVITIYDDIKSTQETKWENTYFVGDDGIEYIHTLYYKFPCLPYNIYGDELITLEEWRQKQLDKLEV